MTRWTVAAGRDMRGLLTTSIDLPLGVSLSARRTYGSKRFRREPRGPSRQDRATPADVRAGVRSVAPDGASSRCWAPWPGLRRGGHADRRETLPPSEKPFNGVPVLPAYGKPPSPARLRAPRRPARPGRPHRDWRARFRGPAWRTSSHPRGAVIRPAWPTHRSQECGSRAVASGPTTAVESE